MTDELDLSSYTRGIIVPNEMTMERALEIINQHHARKPMTADHVYPFSMQISDQTMDTFSTRMDATTLRNYAADFTAGRALMNSHRTGGFLGDAELPIGRTFQGESAGMPLPRSAPYDAPGGGMRVAVYAYIQRGLNLTGIPTNDMIDGIEGGTINDVSVGFTRGETSKYVCNLCGSNMMNYESCRHVPGATYDNGRAYAWVVDFRGREASLVYRGSNSNAVIQKAIRMSADGHLARAEARLLEECWGVRVIDSKSFAVAKAADMQKPSETREEASLNWEDFLKSLRKQDAAQADRIAALPEDERLGALAGVIQEQRATIESVKSRADMGDRWIASLIDDAVAARVRAEGDKFNAERYRKALTTSNDPDYIQDEIKSWNDAAKRVLGDGKRPTGGVKEDEKKPGAPAPRGMYK